MVVFWVVGFLFCLIKIVFVVKIFVVIMMIVSVVRGFVFVKLVVSKLVIVFVIIFVRRMLNMIL